MKHQVEYKGFDPSDKVRKLIETRIGHIDRLCQGLPQDVLFLRVAIEEAATHKVFRVSVTLDVPQKVLAAREEGRDPEAAVRAAFDEAERQLEEYKSRRRGEHWWKRVERRRELKRMQAGGTPTAQSEDPQWFLAFVEPHLPKVREVVGHVLRYAEARGDLPPGDLELDEIIDEALVRAHDEFARAPRPANIRSRLVQFALAEIRKAVRRVQTDRTRIVHIEEDPPEVPPPVEVSTLGDEILEFYQPDEDLRVEDVVPDVEVAPPDKIVESRELAQCVRTALNSLSPEGRSALTLRYIVGLTGKELADSLGKPERDVERLIEEARAQIREELTAAGCTFREGGPVAARR
jgi:RNA polymerase sigma factor (sigma-70 family)